VPVQESFNWSHGVICYGACLESESTAATVGATGVRTFDMMSILQFLAIPLGKYLQNNLSFGQKASKPPRVFGTNYFLKDKEGKYLNGKLDKSVWVKWAELRVHGDVDVIQGPTGCLPKYEDLARLFKQVLNKEYTKDQYVEQFKLRIPANIAKIDRIEKVYREISDTPAEVFKSLAAQKQRLIDLQKSKGDYVSPLDL
jgi:phosphoenolpyruvate carboxykinase (GTP)